MISAEGSSFSALPVRESLTKHSFWPGFIISNACGESTRISLGNNGYVFWPWIPLLSSDTVELNVLDHPKFQSGDWRDRSRGPLRGREL